MPPAIRSPLVALALAAVLATPALAEEHPVSTGVRLDGSSAQASLNAPGSPGVPTARLVAEGLDAPATLAFHPEEGTLYYGEWKNGDVYPVGEDGRPVNPGSPVLDVGEPSWGNERGFLGLAVGEDGAFYTFTTYNRTEGGGWFNRVSRWVGGEETVLLDGLEAADWHNAGRIQWDPRDDSLWVAYGDVNAREVALDPGDLRGKILHVSRGGEPVPGNLANDSLVFSLGHRQPFGFAVNAETGEVMVAENMDTRNDEVSLVKPGGNYGWPLCEGPCDPPCEEFEDPIIYYKVPIGPTSGAWFNGDFYFADFNGGKVHRIHPGEDGAWYDEIVHDHGASILDLKPGPEGNTLYFSTWTGIHRLEFPNVAARDKTPGGDVPEDAGGGAGVPAAAGALVLAAAGIAAALLPRRGSEP